MGLSGLDFMTVAGNFLDAFTRARREDMALRRNAAREDQQISAQRQYESGVREGEHAFQSAMADQARVASRQQSDTEWQRGAEQRAMQQALLQQQLGMSTAQFEEWKATAAGRAEMAKLEGDKTRAEINRLNAEAGHYARMGGGGGGGSVNLNAVTPEERMNSRREALITNILRRFPVIKNPDTGDDETPWDAYMERATAMADKILGTQQGPVEGPAEAPPGPNPFVKVNPPSRPGFNPGAADYNPPAVSAGLGILDAATKRFGGSISVPRLPTDPMSAMVGQVRGPAKRAYRDVMGRHAGMLPEKNPYYDPMKAIADTTYRK